MGLILKQKFHRSRIFSIGAWSGPGCSGEQEVTAIAAGREPVRILQGDAYVGPQGRGQERASDNRFARVYYKSDDETGELRVSGTTNGNLNMTKRADIENAIDEMSKPYTPSAEQAAAIARRNGSAKPPMKAVAPKHEAKQKLPVPGNDTFEKDLAKLLADPKVNIPPDLVEALKKNHALQVKGKP